jgi:hypothetical protein
LDAVSGNWPNTDGETRAIRPAHLTARIFTTPCLLCFAVGGYALDAAGSNGVTVYYAPI